MIQSDLPSSSHNQEPQQRECPQPNISPVVHHFIEKIPNFIIKVKQIQNSTLSSDKIVRLSSATLKIIKNYKLIQTSDKLNPLLKELGQLRRLLRINRLGINFRELNLILFKKQLTKRAFYDIFFKLLMTFTDVNDSLAYLMQLKLIPQIKLSTLRKNTMDFYFYECVVWTLQHCYEYAKGKNLSTNTQYMKKKLYIIKYIIDCITSYNDYSRRFLTIDIKITSILGFISSLIGLIILFM